MGGGLPTPTIMHRCALADESFERFASSIKHIACDRTDAAAMKQLLGNQGFEGEGIGTKLHSSYRPLRLAVGLSQPTQG